MKIGRVVQVEHSPGALLHLATPGRYSMHLAAAILGWLEEEWDECSISDSGWRSDGFGKLVEEGIHVDLSGIQFAVTCSYEDLWIARVAGNRADFLELCEAVLKRCGAG